MDTSPPAAVFTTETTTPATAAREGPWSAESTCASVAMTEERRPLSPPVTTPSLPVQTLEVPSAVVMRELLRTVTVPMPSSVPALVHAYERLYRRCEEMRAMLDALRTEANHLVASSPVAGTALVDLLAVVTDASDPHVKGENGSDRGCSTLQQRGVSLASAGATPTIAIATSTGAGGASLDGGVITGRVVSPGKAGPVVAGSTAESVGARARLSRFVDEFKRDYREECNVLRAQLMAMEAAQTLLSVTRGQLQDAQRGRRSLEEELQAARTQLEQVAADADALRTAALSQHSSVGDVGDADNVSLAAQLSQAKANARQLTEALAEARSALAVSQYHEVQLEQKAKETDTLTAFLREKNAQLEGQLHRLLTAMPPAQPVSAIATRPSAASTDALAQGESRERPPAAPQALATATSTRNEAPPPQPTTATTSSGVTADAYQRAALERQVAELRGIVEKLQKRTEQITEKRRRLEATVTALTSENTELKASVLQYRRQVNESELDMEREVLAKADADRAKAMEKELVRLRNALRERRDSFDAKVEAFEARVAQLQKENRVYKASSVLTQRALLRAQLKLVMIAQQGIARGRIVGTREPSAAKHTDVTAEVINASESHALPGTAISDTAHDSTGVTTLVPPVTPEAATQTYERLPVVPLDSFGAAELQHSREALEEMRALYERRMETLEAQRRAEVRQVQGLNRELRQALTSSQEELREKNRLLELSRAQSGVALPAFAAPLAASGASGDLTPNVETRGTGGGRPTAGSRTLSLDATHHRLLSTDWSVTASGAVAITAGATPAFGTTSGRSLSEIEERYDPERMSVWEAVQVENEALLRRVSTLQEEKWAGDTAVEDLQRQNATLQRELQRNAETMNHLLRAGIVSPAAMQKGQEEGRLRSLQCLLQETLTEKMALEEQVSQLQQRLKRYS